MSNLVVETGFSSRKTQKRWYGVPYWGCGGIYAAEASKEVN
jgi:hypothetical protein